MSAVSLSPSLSSLLSLSLSLRALPGASPSPRRAAASPPRLSLPAPGVFVSVSVASRSAAPQLLSLPLSWAELEVVKTLARHFIPRMLGFDKV